jgi:hypothetical protein
MMTRRTFAIAVRVLAVLAAIYTFFMFRSQLAEQRSPREGAIPAKVISNDTACGWLTVSESSSNSGEEIRLDQNSAILTAIETPGKRIAVRNEAECERLNPLNGSNISSEKRRFKIQFERAN